jgi:ABC-type lipoprotein release transport system permease subunit
MTTVLRLAWRNVWRNPRRTGLTVAATVFAVFLVILFVAMADGSHSKMIEDSVRIQSGHVQLAADGYLENRTLEYYLELDAPMEAMLTAAPEVEGWAPRVNSAALLSLESSTHGVVLLGVDPERERSVSTLDQRVETGEFLPATMVRPIVLGQQLADNLGAVLGDEILVYSMSYTLENAYELFEFAGTVKLPDPSFERGLAIVRLADAQEFLVYGERVNEVALRAESAQQVPALSADLAVRLAGRSGVSIHPWNEVMPELEQFIIIDDAGMYIMLVILVIVVGFGILNTILMSVMERQRELGAMLALGLRPVRLFSMIYAESMMLAGIGLIVGMALALPTVLWFIGHPIPLSGEGMEAAAALVGMEPIVVFELRDTTLPGAALTILGVAALAALYPAFKAGRARPVDALRSL